MDEMKTKKTEDQTNWPLIGALGLLCVGLLVLGEGWPEWIGISMVAISIAWLTAGAIKEAKEARAKKAQEKLEAAERAKTQPQKPAAKKPAAKKRSGSWFFKALGWGAVAGLVKGILNGMNRTAEYNGGGAMLGGVFLLFLLILLVQYVQKVNKEPDGADEAKAAFAAPERSTIDAQKTGADKADNMGRNAGGAGPDVVE